jgi:putative chitinase
MPTEPSPASVSHTVVWGDTLFGLAQRYGTTVDAIVRVNNLPNENYIRVGQVLQIPRGDQPVGVPAAPGGTVSYTVQPGDTLYGIASRYGTTVQAIAQANGVVNPAFIRVGQQLSIPTGSTADVPASPGGNVYVVVPGDTLSSIAARYGTTAWAIAYANNLPNANWIRVGQTLIIPAP